MERNKDHHTSFLTMNEKLLIFETGLNHQQFNNLLAYIQEINMPHRNKEFALGVYLSRLRRGYTFDELAIHYNITRKTASEYANSCR